MLSRRKYLPDFLRCGAGEALRCQCRATDVGQPACWVCQAYLKNFLKACFRLEGLSNPISAKASDAGKSSPLISSPFHTAFTEMNRRDIRRRGPRTSNIERPSCEPSRNGCENFDRR